MRFARCTARLAKPDLLSTGDWVPSVPLGAGSDGICSTCRRVVSYDPAESNVNKGFVVITTAVAACGHASQLPTFRGQHAVDQPARCAGKAR